MTVNVTRWDKRRPLLSRLTRGNKACYNLCLALCLSAGLLLALLWIFPSQSSPQTPEDQVHTEDQVHREDQVLTVDQVLTLDQVLTKWTKVSQRHQLKQDVTR